MISQKKTPASDEYYEAATEFQLLGERLYGKPDQETTEQMYGEIFAQAHEKQLDPRLTKILDELTHGTQLKIAGGDVSIPALVDKAKGRLPVFEADILQPLVEVLEEDTPFIREITQRYWDEVIMPRSIETGKEPSFSPDDMVAVFIQTRDFMDPENKAGIAVNKVPGKLLSWDTPTTAVQVGETRITIKDVGDMTAKVTHELYKHGGSAIKGLSSKLPVLGTGLYTDADQSKGERPDYLAFEEGIATMAEMVVNGKGNVWGQEHISRYLAVCSTYDGADYRTAYEINWRARVLIAAKSGVEMTDKEIQREQKQAYTSMTRIRRATPTQLTTGPVVSFNKDTAYLPGKLMVYNYLKSLKETSTKDVIKAKIRRVFASKYDPTNPIQDALAERYGKAQ